MAGDPFEFPDGVPDFVRVVINKGAEQARAAAMHLEDFDNRWFDLIQTASVEQLLTLREVLNIEAASARLNYLDGMVVSVLRLQHKVCTGCGQDHAQLGLDELASAGLGEPEEPQE